MSSIPIREPPGITPCWTIMRTPRAKWVMFVRSEEERRCTFWPLLRDMFGFEVHDYGLVFCNPIEARGDLVVRRVQYSSHYQLREDTRVRMNNLHEDTFPLKAVVSVISIKHFVHWWIRNAKRSKTLKRRRYVMLLLTQGQVLNARVHRIVCDMLS